LIGFSLFKYFEFAHLDEWGLVVACFYVGFRDLVSCFKACAGTNEGEEEQELRDSDVVIDHLYYNIHML